ncbi:unnamed protein product [Heterobilharzia americana]|nr:unnamed protein product [Heterobilharzia americana]
MHVNPSCAILLKRSISPLKGTVMKFYEMDSELNSHSNHKPTGDALKNSSFEGDVKFNGSIQKEKCSYGIIGKVLICSFILSVTSRRESPSVLQKERIYRKQPILKNY